MESKLVFFLFFFSKNDVPKPIEALWLRIFRPTVDLDFETDAVPLNGRGAGHEHCYEFYFWPNKTPQKNRELRKGIFFRND